MMFKRKEEATELCILQVSTQVLSFNRDRDFRPERG